jgi:hypothetical protein
MKQAVTVVVATRSPERWPTLVRAVASARSQTVMPAEVVVVVDHDQELFRRVRRDLAGVTVLESAYLPGLSGARNTGGFHAQTSLIAFLDDDTVADPAWLGRVIATLTDPAVIGAGADITPEWQTGRPRWLPQSLLWAAGTADRRNPAGTVLRREQFRQAGGFATGNDDFGARFSGVGGGRWAYVTEGLIRHLVPARVTFGAFLHRCYTQGSSRAWATAAGRTGLAPAVRARLAPAGRARLAAFVPTGRGTAVTAGRAGAVATGRGAAAAAGRGGVVAAARAGAVLTGRALVRDLRAGRLLRAGGMLAGIAAAGIGAVARSVRARRVPQRALAPAR